MNSLLHSNSLPPHLLVNSRLSPQRDIYSTPPTNMSSSRKRKASEDPPSSDHDMSPSPTASPNISSHHRPRQTSAKRTRTSTLTSSAGRPLPLPRLLETLSADQMRLLLQNVCDQHPALHQEIVSKAPRPSIESTLSVLSRYESHFRSAFPLGNRTTSDYAYNRVHRHLIALIEAVREYTPHFLPPYESSDAQSLTYLDAVTHMIHRLPDWDTYLHQRHKDEAYDEIAKAWGLVIREAKKRAGGFHLQFGGWDQKLVEHNQKSGGRMEEAVDELKAATGFGAPTQEQGTQQGVSDERASIRQQLFSGTYGQQLGVGRSGSGW